MVLSSSWRRRDVLIASATAFSGLAAWSYGRSRGLGVVLRFTAELDPVMRNYFVDPEGRDRSREGALIVPKNALRELTCTPHRGSPELTWIEVEWLHPIDVNAPTGDEVTVGAVRYARLFQLSSLIPATQVDRIRSSGNQLLALTFKFRNTAVEASWSIMTW